MSFLRLKCTNRFWLGLCPIPYRGAYRAPRAPWLDFRGLLLREGRGRDEDRAVLQIP